MSEELQVDLPVDGGRRSVDELTDEHRDHTWRDRHGFEWRWTRWADGEWAWGRRHASFVPFYRYDLLESASPTYRPSTYRPFTMIERRRDAEIRDLVADIQTGMNIMIHSLSCAETALDNLRAQIAQLDARLSLEKSGS
jgi:hypothetical protein